MAICINFMIQIQQALPLFFALPMRFYFFMSLLKELCIELAEKALIIIFLYASFFFSSFTSHIFFILLGKSNLHHNFKQIKQKILTICQI